MGSFLRITIIILVFAFLGSLLIHNLDSINQDIGRHLKSGQIIWESKSVYKTNLFSYTEPNHPFLNHHWLSEVVFFLLSGFIGLKGLIIFKTVVILGAFALLFLAVHKKSGTGPVLIAVLIAALVFSERTDVRPEIFSYIFLSFFIFAIFKAKLEKQTHWLYALPLIQVLWTNMHIYFALGPLLLLIFLIDRLVHHEYRHRFLLVFLVVSSATLLNPNFIQGALLPFNILRDYGYTIVENQSTAFLKDYGILLKQISLFEFSLVVLSLSFVLAIRKGRRKITFELLATVAFAALALKMVRNFGVYALLIAPVLALNFQSLYPVNRVRIKKKNLIGYVVFTFTVLLLITGVINNNFYHWLGMGKQFGLTIPAGATAGVEFVKNNHIEGPVFNNFDVGSFLIWKLYPDQKVFIDGRPEAYSQNFIENVYKSMQLNTTVWQKYSEQYAINYVFFDHHDFTPWARTFLQNITKNPEWIPVYLDDSIIILVKNIPANQKLIEKYPLAI